MKTKKRFKMNHFGNPIYEATQKNTVSYKEFAFEAKVEMKEAV